MTQQEIDNAIARAIARWLPVKPTFVEGSADGELLYDTWHCPCCEKGYELRYEEYDYCPCCGQHIDWQEWKKIRARHMEEGE